MAEQEIGRLALRAEGDNWNAYYADQDTMKGALYLGSIRISIIQNSGERKEEFMSLMKEVVADIIEEVTGIRPLYRNPKTAPEHERSGNA